eukprot:CAMPEP_0198209046 /NCGR_PEP_ID=MMETSP1445-20131203/12370_1 /TAXON_ID=36898 /ORGANISM="Pyramimonas sp., Strain CCMP2087" /LENGTH=60 /DNA_ID=CAMNT_0043882675 /DNA_START=133 /DNA_END=315 /DNA_ORIENTATION=+
MYRVIGIQIMNMMAALFLRQMARSEGSPDLFAQQLDRKLKKKLPTLVGPQPAKVSLALAA